MRRGNAHTIGMLAALTVVTCAPACRGEEAPGAAGPAPRSVAEAAAIRDGSATSDDGDSAESVASHRADDADLKSGAGLSSSPTEEGGAATGPTSSTAGFADVVEGPPEVRRGGLRRTLLRKGHDADRPHRIKYRKLTRG